MLGHCSTDTVRGKKMDVQLNEKDHRMEEFIDTNIKAGLQLYFKPVLW